MMKLSKERIESIEKIAAESAEHRAALIACGAPGHGAGVLFGSVLSGGAVVVGALCAGLLLGLVIGILPSKKLGLLTEPLLFCTKITISILRE